MSLQDAVTAEREDRLIEAAEAYETLLREERPRLEALLNLAVLYWQVTDYGYWTTKGLPQDFVTRAGQRVPELLARAQELYPDSTEARFWAKYIDWADLGEPFEVEECRALLRDDPRTLAPALFLFSQSEGSECEAEATELLRQSKQSGTTLGRYVESVIEGVLTRRGT